MLAWIACGLRQRRVLSISDVRVELGGSTLFYPFYDSQPPPTGVEDVCLWILTHRWTEVSAAMLAATRAVDWDDVAATACADTQVLACLPGQQHSGASGGSTPPARDL